MLGTSNIGVSRGWYGPATMFDRIEGCMATTISLRHVGLAA
jgi:hypothetical protein